MSNDDKNNNKQEDEDESIVSALSTLGWVEEKEEEEEPLSTDENILEQLNFFRDENKKLIGAINEKLEIIGNLETKVQELSTKLESESSQSEATQKLYEIIENKNDEIERLNSVFEEEVNKSQKIIDDQLTKIKDLTTQVDESQPDQTELIKSKDDQIKELKEQLQYLESDTIQKSKFQKLEVLLEKKDEIITEKEKAIFSLENSLKNGNQKIQEIQQQSETFNLVKKDLEKKSERNKELAVKIEQLNQKNSTNLEIINRLEEKLEEAHKKSGNITGKFELELGNLRNLLDGKDNEIKPLREKLISLDTELHEYKKIEDKILGDIQILKDDNLKLESDIEEKDEEIIELKKRIKLMRRDLKKS
jgi:chromosome segregation ATPase